VNVRAARTDEWSRLRDIRLRALRDAPEAFGQTHEEVANASEGDWRAWIEGWGASHAHVAFIAEEGERWIGMAVGDVHDPRADHAHLFAMWVDPSMRHRGVGAALVEAVVAWTRELGLSGIHLTVAQQNPAAGRLYERFGFVRNGASRPIRDGSPLRCDEMELVL
jgi:GNAT superfamily N-acetyltransferase